MEYIMSSLKEEQTKEQQNKENNTNMRYILIGTTAINRPKLHSKNIRDWRKWINGVDPNKYKIKWFINIDVIEDLSSETEVVELQATYDTGPVFISLYENKGFINEHGESTEVKIDEFKKQNFWKKLDELGVWNWHSKYPHKKPKYEPPTCQVYWSLKIINHDKSKYCSGYYFFPRNFKKFVKELNNLMGVEFKID